MAWNGWKVIDMDSHIVERPEDMYDDYIDPLYREKLDRLKRALQENIKKGVGNSIASSRYAVMAPIVSDNALGDHDTFGMVPREFILHPTDNRRNFGRPDRPDLPITRRKEASSDVKVRLEDMDASYVDVDVLYPTLVSSDCVLHDIGFETALYTAYHRWGSDFCSQAPDRLKWTLVVNMRDPEASCEEIRYWAETDMNMVGIYMPPQGPDNMLLDNPTLFPVYGLAQDLDLPILLHGGTARPPYGPGTFDLQGAWFLQHGLGNPWAGMSAMGTLIGGGIFERFSELRAGIVETAAGWLPAILDRFDAHYVMSPAHVPYLKHMPSEFVKQQKRYFHGIDTWERTLEWVVEFVGEDVLLFATDWPHGDTAWPEGVQQVVEWPGLSDSAKKKILAENAMLLCPRLRS